MRRPPVLRRRVVGVRPEPIRHVVPTAKSAGRDEGEKVCKVIYRDNSVKERERERERERINFS